MKEFGKIIGYESVKNELLRICDIIRFPEKYKKFGVNAPKGILLYGEPGVGKTLFAEEFIKICGLPSFTCRKNKPNGKFVDSLHNTFVKAKQCAPSIIFLDDMDKFANEDNNHRDAEEYVTIQADIDSSKNSGVIVVATVNDMNKLPNSLVRAGRFDTKIEVKPPTRNDAEKIISHYLGKKNFLGELDTKFISRILQGRSCAELESIINEAGLIAGFEGKDKVENDAIVRACLRIIYNAPECMDSNIDEKELLQIAYHEAGHAVVADVLEPESVNIVSVKQYCGDIGGLTDYNQNENYFHHISFMENRVRVLLAGKAATELVYGETDCGATSDLGRAMRIIRRFSDDYGAHGFEYAVFEYDCSPILAAKIESLVANDLKRYYDEAKKILIQNRHFLDAIANELLKKHVLTFVDITNIKNSLAT